MKCAECQDYLATVYVDGELTAHQRAAVDNHLSACSSCREFRSAVLKTAVQPFTSLQPAAVPEHIWPAVKNRLEQSRRAVTPAIRTLWWRQLRIPQVVVLSIPVAALLLAVFLVPARSPGTGGDQTVIETAALSQNEENYFNYLYGDEDQDASADPGFGTSTEALISL